MAKRLTAISQTRPRLISQGEVDLEGLARGIAKNTTYNPEEVYSVLRMLVRAGSTSVIPRRRSQRSTSA